MNDPEAGINFDAKKRHSFPQQDEILKVSLTNIYCNYREKIYTIGCFKHRMKTILSASLPPEITTKGKLVTLLASIKQSKWILGPNAWCASGLRKILIRWQPRQPCQCLCQQSHLGLKAIL